MSDTLFVGVLALQGAFAEHIQQIKKISGDSRRFIPIEVRTTTDLAKCDAVILPGGESTAMRIIAKGDANKSNEDMFTALRDRIELGMPVFGTCAGCILLSDRVSSSLGGGDNSTHRHIESLDASVVYGEHHIGGLDVNTCRNFFGRQTKSFMTKANSTDPLFQDFPCVFIRAPAIASVGSKAKILATVHHDGEDVIVAARQGNILGTCFHPEISNDSRVHEYFLSIAEEYVRSKRTKE